jgi:phosphoribosylamine--glycine ligase
MKILVIGSGGREHALAWKISQSSKVKKIFCAPGNPGTKDIAENIAIDSSGIQGLADFAAKEKIDLSVVGPELPLTLGIVDEFEKKKLKIFGPNKNAAELEGSKIFAKQFMERHKIPTGKYKIAESAEEAKKILSSGEFPYPLVMKADGLAAGKGVIICKNKTKADEAVSSMFVEKTFGKAGSRVLIEEFLSGVEVSFILISDGLKVLPFVTTMDHKKIFDGDIGLNTGGMGAISPSPFLSREVFDIVVKDIVFPTVTRMLEEGRRYKGVLYVGLMLTNDGPKVLEYNCRFGDPETQPQMLRMESDLVDILQASVDECILDAKIKWNKKAAGCVIAASGGYPARYKKGLKIEGLKEAMKASGITIFHAGTKFEDGEYFTDGGRVFGVCATENTLKDTMTKIYGTLSKISFSAMHYRKDIGALKEG